MKLIPLPFETIALRGWTHKAIITAADVAALGAATTGTLQIVPDVAADTNPAGMAVHRVGLNLTTAFDASDAAINSLTIEIGDGGDTNRFLGPTEIAVDGTEILFEVSRLSTYPYAYTTADGIDAFFTVAGGASPLLNEINAGQVELYLELENLNEMEVVT
ncbi:MAG: hypothetical protein HW378_189 [Anaerolineales bacterium]|nr:hypothetical protein [Anaerolineales bacterium]